MGLRIPSIYTIFFINEGANLRQKMDRTPDSASFLCEIPDDMRVVL